MLVDRNPSAQNPEREIQETGSRDGEREITRATTEMSPKRRERAWKIRSCHRLELFTSSHQSEALRSARKADEEAIRRRLGGG